MTDLLTVPVVTADGEETTLDEHRGKVMLIVNVASRCGLAPQYAELEELQKKYSDRGFVVLGFPSNQFFQELGTNDAIAQYCSTTWGVTFPIFDKIRVNGKGRAPLYAELVKAKDESGIAGNIRWNFEKFVVTPNGTIHRFRPTTKPSDPAIVSLIEENLPR
jgi:glutathione peroxidase